MPELPEVETYKKYIAEVSLDQKILRLDMPDAKTLAAPAEDLESALVGHSFEKIERIGKYLLFQISSDQYLTMHFGMTGSPEYIAKGEKLPRHTRFFIEFKDGGEGLAFVCPRKLGRIGLSPDLPTFQKEKKLSDDALQLSFEAFRNNVGKRSAVVKSLLLDQKVCAGVGNWIADEILHQARIHPERRANTLEETEWKQVYERMQEIIRMAISHDADYELYPKTYLIHKRGWTQQTPSPCQDCEGEVAHIKVGGRATYFCPVCQQLPPSGS